ncbi:hypothetical protein [Paenibacillus polysaccharolyticus]|uniref:hypothetical protein n=1 Tax=Paenibacillus polysaccharolyticus TaxID=582692 RepID=UPI00142DF07A|nr:hypothetical protein [Paenibacillus polysaccharolyticus]
MVHEGAKRPPLFPGFDRGAGQNESEKPGNNPRPEELSTPKQASQGYSNFF